MRTGTCDRCGTEFVDSSAAQKRRFCSDNCRKRHCDDTTMRHPCVDCSKSICHGSTRCLDCALVHQASLVGPRLEALWAEGKTIREIAGEFGWTMDTARPMISIYRARGFDLPYRRSAQDIDHIRAGIRDYWSTKEAAA